MKTFPIMNEKFPLVPSSVPWEFIAPFENGAQRNHGQSLQRLSERGGLDVTEALAVIENRRWERMDYHEAAKKFNHLLREFNDREAIMPGAWVCPKCDFTLQKNTIFTQSGNIAADTSPFNQVCPNDGQMMKPLTWRKANEDIYNQAIKDRRLLNALRDNCRIVFHPTDERYPIEHYAHCKKYQWFLIEVELKKILAEEDKKFSEKWDAAEQVLK